MYRKTKTLMLSMAMTLTIACGNIFEVPTDPSMIVRTTVISMPVKTVTETTKPIVRATAISTPVVKSIDTEKSIKPTPKKVTKMSVKDIRLIALVTMAEAEGECERGKRVVIDTILNRLKSPYFPKTIHNVIYQPHQFTSMWTKRITRCYVRDDIIKLVEEELESQVDYEVVIFTAGGYNKYGVPKYRIGNHYFSKYE